MKPLKITAHLRSGFSAAFDWSVAIDGIIAYQSQLKKLGWDQFTQNQSTGDLKPVDDLPIAKEAWRDDWWYQVSRPFFNCRLVYTKHLHRRFNAQEAEQHVTKINKIETTKGPYKNARLAKKLYVTDKVIWYVNGDKEQIESLLSQVTHIGGNRGSGHGAVKYWTVEDHYSLDDCRFKRATPIEFAQANDMQGFMLEWAIKPPYTLSANQRACVIPENIMDETDYLLSSQKNADRLAESISQLHQGETKVRKLIED